MKKLRNNKIRKLLAFMVALALMVSCMPSAYTISASEAFGDGTEDIFTDGEITSEPAAEESTPDVSSADQEETEQAQQSTLTYENDSVKVTAEALEDGALPQNTALKADGVNENSSVSYDTVSQKLSAAATDKGSSLRGFFAYDVYFADGDGNRVEPNGRVRVTFEYKTPAAPELTDAASTSVTVEKLHYNSSTGDTDVNTLQANEDLKVLNVNESKQIQTLQVETGNAAVFAVMWDSPETADVEAETVSGNEDGVSIASEELTDGMDISDEPEQDAAETPAAENPEVTPEAEPSEEPAENPDAEPTEAPAEDPDVVEEPAEDIASPDEVPAADENGETSLIEVLGDDTNLRVSPSIEAEVLATVNAGTQLTLLDTVTAEDGATWYKVSWEGTEAYIRSDMAQVVDSSDDAEEVEDVLESEEVSYSQEVGNVVVTATAVRGVIPEDAQFVVNPIEKDSDQYEDVADRLEKKAENEDYSIVGFLAYDIYFQDSEGNKINPEEGKVKVSMEYKNATAPDEVKEADAATMAMASADENSQDDTEAAEQNLSVSVMHFVEDENGNVESVVDMTKDDTANVETNAEGEVQKAEFETESFSTFTITWTYKNYYTNVSKNITVHYVDFEGNDILYNQNNSESVKSGNSVDLKRYAKSIDNYTYVGARIDKYNGDSLKYIKATYTYDRNNNSWSWSIQYSTDNQNWQTSTITNVDIYLLYQEPLSIKDDLMDSGTLIPQISDALQTQIKNSKNVKYTWYKSINKGNFEKVKRVKVTKNKYNIEEDATTKLSTMNVALDHGELSNTQTSVKYQVGLSIDGSEEILSGVYNVEYYRELRNGDFETPNVVTSGHTNTNNWQYSNENYKKLGGVWQTTGTHAASQYSDPEGADIEIVTTATNDLSGYSWHGDVKDASGKNNSSQNSEENGKGKGQFAELNCEASGALYQDVMTYANEELSYGLSHRARGESSTKEYDTMYVVIMPTKIAKTAANGSELKTQDQLVKYIQKKIENKYTTRIATKEEFEECYNNNDNDGVYIARISSDDQDWNTIIQNRVYTAKSTLTRFCFVAGTTSSGKATVGNFLDNVQFTQGLVAADPDRYTLQITKAFNNITDEQIEQLKDKLTFTIKVYSKDNPNVEITEQVLPGENTFKLKDMIQNETDGTYYKLFENKEMSANAQYLFKVEESCSDIKGYKCTTTETITGGIVQQDGKSTLIVGGNAANFKFTNTYVNNQKNISFTKIWDDFDNYYGSRPKNLNITLQGKVNNQVVKSYVVALSNASAVLTEENEDGVTVERASSGNTNAWKCIWQGVPIYDDDNNLIAWSVKEGEVDSSYAYQESEVRVGDGSNYQGENTSVIVDSEIETVTDENANIPTAEGNSETTQSTQDNVESNDAAVMSASDSGGDETAVQTDVNNTSDTGDVEESFYIVNKLVTEQVTVSKYWDDNHNEYENRPSSLNINLKVNNESQRTICLKAGSESNTADKWSATLTVPKLKKGNSYSAEEELPSDGYYECTTSKETGNNIYFVNKQVKRTLVVEKIWNDGNNANSTRPASVSFKLQYRDSNSDEWSDYTKDGSNVTVTLDKNNVIEQDTNCWRSEIKNLDVSKEYRVVEQEVPSNYTESYSKDKDFTSITNTLKWKVVKAGSSNEVKLGGAEFKLTNANNETVTTGTSANDTGEVSWNEPTAELNGTYTLTETKAPSGYCISGTTWSLVFVNGVLTGLSDGSDKRNCDWDGSNATLTITNTELYSLPSAGGPGTYGFTISGVAILATALLLFINNKRREEEAKRS